MIAFDTNVLVRLLVGDDPEQQRVAENLLEEAIRKSETCYLSDPVLCEMEWVLESCYRASRRDVLAALDRCLLQPFFVFRDRDTVTRAVSAYRRGRGDFSDYLIGVSGTEKGVSTTFTFDRALRDGAEFTVA